MTLFAETGEPESEIETRERRVKVLEREREARELSNQRLKKIKELKRREWQLKHYRLTEASKNAKKYALGAVRASGKVIRLGGATVSRTAKSRSLRSGARHIFGYGNVNSTRRARKPKINVYNNTINAPKKHKTRRKKARRYDDFSGGLGLNFKAKDLFRW